MAVSHSGAHSLGETDLKWVRSIMRGTKSQVQCATQASDTRRGFTEGLLEKVEEKLFLSPTV